MGLERFARELALCTYCPKMCRFACPVALASSNEALTPTAKQVLVRLVHGGRVPLDGETARAFFACTGCRLCRLSCEHGVEVWQVLWEARSLACAAGILPRHPASLATTLPPPDLGPAFEAATDAWPRRGDPGGGALAVLASAATLLGRPATVRALGSLLARTRVEARLLGGPELPDAGYDLWALGCGDALAERARAVVRKVEGVRRLVCLDPHDLWVLEAAGAYAPLRRGVELTSLPAFLLELASTLGPGRLHHLPGTFTYHDPCPLARHRDEGGVARRLLTLVLAEPVREAPPGGGGGYGDGKGSGYGDGCCGGGGGVPLVDPDLAHAMARRRLAALSETDAEGLVTACPHCETLFGEAGRPALDLTELLARAVGAE